MLNLKYAMSAFQKRSKLVGCIQSVAVYDVIKFGIISGDYYLRLLLDEGGSTKIVKAYANFIYYK